MSGLLSAKGQCNNKHTGETTGLVNGQPGFIYQQHSLAGAYILMGVAAGFLTSSIVTFVSAKNHARKALKIYNQRFEQQPDDSHPGARH